jgi:hypothetical protein
VIVLAYNANAVLIKTDNREYWYIVSGFRNKGCYDSQSETYKAIDALKSFEKQFGEAVYKHERIESL